MPQPAVPRYFALRDAPELLTLSVLALTGGALTSVVVEEMLTEAHEGDATPLGPVALTAGFALITVYVGYPWPTPDVAAFEGSRADERAFMSTMWMIAVDDQEESAADRCAGQG